MKLLVFAHTPPPHHGQSYMVQLMLDGFGGDARRHRAKRNHSPHGIDCYLVNARLSRNLEDIGELRPGKLLLLLGYCLEAIYCRFRYGVTTLYYIPAPGKRSALYRDWLVMALCRLFFKKIILHWHASGLAKWLETNVQIHSRAMTYRFAKQANLSIVLSNYGRADADKLYPRRVAVVGNGIPDPCPDFPATVLPRRQARAQVRQLLLAGQHVSPDLLATAGDSPQVFKVLFLGHCTRDKGLFEAVEGAISAHQELKRSGLPITLKLLVAGEFAHAAEEAEFRRLCATQGQEAVEYVGYIAGGKKRQLLEEADTLCFPSHLESFGLVLVEAMAFGLPVVTTRCGAIPEVMPPDYPGLVDVRAPDQIAAALRRMMHETPFAALRQRYEANYTMERHLENLAAALRSVEQNETSMAGQWTAGAANRSC